MNKDISDEKSDYIYQIKNYLQNKSTSPAEFQLGTEMEFFIIKNASGKAVTYFEENGINDILQSLTNKGWKVCEREGEYILCLIKNEDEINLEPGAQIEFSFSPRDSIDEIRKGFLNIAGDILPLIKSLDYSLISLGYQPVTKISSIPILPKKRYDHMYRYFKSQGKYAHNMMKATASLQVSLDYKNERDFSRKFLAASWLIPVIYAVFDNSPFFEGEVANSWGIRSQIWANCDDDRSGTLPEYLINNGVSFEDYAEFIIHLPAIFNPYNHEEYVGSRPFYQILNNENLSNSIMEHILTMSFTDIRAKGYLEIRMADTLPFPYSLGYIALLKGLLYNKDNLKKLESLAIKTGIKSIKEGQDGIPHQGINLVYTEGKTFQQWAEKLFCLAEKGLNDLEKIYLHQLKEFLQENSPPRTAVQKQSLQNIDDSSFINKIEYCNIKNNLGVNK